MNTKSSELVKTISFMHKGLEFSSLPLEVGANSKDSFTDFTSLDFDDLNCDGSPFDEDPLSDSSQYQPCSESWEDFQSLSPFGLDWEMEQEFFKSDITDLECKKQGPTLAELNNQRSTSPLINPEMERLHRIATRSDGDRSSTSSSCDIKIRIDGPDRSETSKQKVVSSTRTENVDGYNGESYPKGWNIQSYGSEVRAQESTVVPRNNASSTITIKQGPTETIELKHSDLMKRIAYLEAKSNSQTVDAAPNSGVRSVADVSAAIPSNRRRTTSECSSIDEEHLSVIREESADEDMDSDDDFEENHLKDSLEVPAKQRKGRRGDVEDMNPNPKKLLEISRELNRLTKVITDLKPIHSLPMTARNKSKKEKNKLASRACRLKKKAQHESNKLKLYGLELEHKRLVLLIEQVKKEIVTDTQGFTITGELSKKVEKLIHDTVGNQIVAGHTTAFVESVLKVTASSMPGYKDADIHLNI